MDLQSLAMRSIRLRHFFSPTYGARRNAYQAAQQIAGGRAQQYRRSATTAPGAGTRPVGPDPRRW